MEKKELQSFVKKALEDYITKSDLKKIIDDKIDKKLEDIKKDLLNKDDIKAIVRKTIVNQYKVLWEKSSFYINKI